MSCAFSSRCLLRRVELFPLAIACLGLLVGIAPLAAQEPASAPDWVGKLPPAPKEEVDFVKDVRPIIQASCYSCHGPEEQEGGLRLDIRERALEGGDSGKSIKPKDLANSPLMIRVAGADEDLDRMPPEGEGRPLNEKELSILRAWIEQGAAWPDGVDGSMKTSHWAFQPIQRSDAPKVALANWVRNPVDAFVLARLEKEGVAPSTTADRSTLIRRVYLDVTGLPPSPAAVQAFLDDKSPNAYAKIVEDALASKHYGERWGRHWLDLARYADSDGYEKDRPRPHAWRYREWVIKALNADVPFDQFSIAQIAGDMIPNAGNESRVATGFHRNTLHNTEGGTDKEEDRVKKTVDRTNTISSVWLGLTVGCAQCHTHKYDPITQREYYSIYAFFNNIDEKDIPAPLPAEQARYEKLKKAHDAIVSALQKKVDDYRRDKLPKAARDWAAKNTTPAVVWQAWKADSAQSKHKAKLQRQKDGSYLASGPNKLSDVYTLNGAAPNKLSAIRLEVLNDKSLVKNGPGRANNGNFVLTTFKARLLPQEGEPIDLKFVRAEATFAQTQWDAKLAINDNPKDGWAVGPQFSKPHTAMFVLEQPVESPAGAKLELTLDQAYFQTEPHNLGRFRLTFTDSTAPSLKGVSPQLAAAINTAADARTAAHWKAIENHVATVDKPLLALTAKVDAQKKKAPQAPKTMAQTTLERGSPRQARIHIRGDFLNPGEPVTANTLAVLPAIETRAEREAADRLDFARWLFTKENPLTARVTVNRLWQRYFGVGLVATADDFGSQGEAPSHPQLLDWLASELRDHDWSLKHVHRLILNSATYRQSSAARPELADRDPQNLWLARQNRYRVEAEIVRDLALAASGLLDDRVGGPSVRPPQPTEYSSLTYANSAKWQVSKGGDAYRRGLYTFFQRTSPYPMLMTFDSPDSNACTVRRASSNTPLQALTLWNDPVFFECAQHLGKRIFESVKGDSPESDTQRVEQAFLICLARRPTANERAWINDVREEVLKLAASEPEIAKQLTAGVGKADSPQAGELAAWVAVGRVLLNIDEFISKE